MKYTLPLLAVLTTALLAGCQQGAIPQQSEQAVTGASQTVDALVNAETETEAPETETVSAENLNAQAINAWPTIKAGSTGNDVKAVQYLLNAHGFAIAVDGDFGPATTAKVKEFQSKFQSLGDTGVVDAATWQQLIVDVKNGSEGNGVKAVQTYLGLEVDGKFGPGTEAAVKSFQSSNGLSADGVVGDKTWQALIAGSNTPAGSTDRAKLAQQVLANKRITLTHSSSTTNGSPYQTILDTSKGLKATSGCNKNANCGAKTYLDSKMLNGMLKMATKYTFQVNSTMGSGEHSPTSYHYRGRAFDVNVINGGQVNASNSNFRAFMAACRANGAVEVLGPGDSGHSTHIHCAF